MCELNPDPTTFSALCTLLISDCNELIEFLRPLVEKSNLNLDSTIPASPATWKSRIGRVTRPMPSSADALILPLTSIDTLIRSAKLGLLP